MLKLTLNWLKRHMNFHNDDVLFLIKQIDLILNNKSIEIEEIKLINPFIVTEITDYQRKEGLKVGICKTILDEDIAHLLCYKQPEIQVLCGANNPKIGLKTILAPIGTKVGDFVIAHRQIKGEDSYGMFCSYEELSEPVLHEGIVETILPLGSIYKIDDVIFKVSTPTNRWDLMSVRGVARELCYAGLGDLKPLSSKIGQKEMKQKIHTECDVPVSFMSVDNISINEEIKGLMDLIDLKQNSDLKYLNDFVLLDVGHPIHIYDADGISEINLRKAHTGKKITTLKNNEFTCRGSEIIIEMNKNPACIGGIIGGHGFNKDTKNVIIEAGYFMPENISQIITDASKLFNLGIDFEQETCAYVGSLISGDLSQIVRTHGRSVEKNNIELSYSNFFSVTDLDISMKNIKINLEKYGFIVEIGRVKRNDNINDEFTLFVNAPSWRTDIKIPEDVIEEIMRIVGFDDYFCNQEELFEINKSLKYTDFHQTIRENLMHLGFSEIYTFPFVSTGELQLVNSLNIEKSYMRDSLLETSKNSIITTLDNSNQSSLLFEIGKIYPSEDIYLGLIISGESRSDWCRESVQYDFFYLKNVLEKLSKLMKINLSNAEELSDERFIYGLKFNNGIIGKLKIDGLLKRSIYYAEIFIKKCCRMCQTKLITTQKIIYENITLEIPKHILFDQIAKHIDTQYYLYDYYPKGDLVKYGITLMFNDNDPDIKNKTLIIREKLHKLIH
jgi:phenylalanyl-tRNA synthetase beta chain